MSSASKTSLRSVQQTHDSIIDTLRRAGEPISAPELFRRMGMDGALSRNTLATLVKQQTVLASPTKPALYRLPKSFAATPRHVRVVEGLYQGNELQRNVGIDPARLEAFALPSRVGNRLHYPDGRVEVVA